jgi:hypothetical protein
VSFVHFRAPLHRCVPRMDIIEQVKDELGIINREIIDHVQQR